jgi:hypothetical protein
MPPPPDVTTPAPVDATQSAADTALFGKDPMPRLVDVHPMMDRPSDEPARVRVYQRSEDFATIHEQEDTFFPFFFLSDFSLLADRYRDGDVHTATPLSGDNFYQYLLTFETWSDYWDALRQVENRSDSDQQRPTSSTGSGPPPSSTSCRPGGRAFSA